MTSWLVVARNFFSVIGILATIYFLAAYRQQRQERQRQQRLFSWFKRLTGDSSD